MSLMDGEDVFGQVYDRAYLEMQRHTRETDNRRLNGAAREIAKYVVNLVREREAGYQGGNDD